MSTSTSPAPIQRFFFFALLLLVTGGLALIVILIPNSTSLASGPLEAGDVAPQDIRAPFTLTYQSDLLTEEQRKFVAADVEPIYSSANPSIARQQLGKLRAALAYISVVRDDQFASTEQKLIDLSKLDSVQLNEETSRNILSLSNTRWETVEEESTIVLEQVMRSTIREDRLADARRGIPSLISLSIPEDQALIVAELVSAFVVPNSLYNETLTENARQQARETVTPINRTFISGETIVERGRVITDIDVEALTQYDLLQSKPRWQDMVGALSLVAITLGFLTIYLHQNSKLGQDLRGLMVATLLFLVFLFGARLIIPGHTIIPYVFPLAAYSLTIAALFGPQVALVTSIPLIVLATYGLSYALELTLYYLLTAFFGILTLGKARRMSNFFTTGVVVSIAGAAVVLAYRLPDPNTDWYGLLTLVGSSVVYGIASSGMTLLLQFFLAQVLGMTTALQLMELSRPDHPLLQLLLRNAPGTYQHSLQVANLAEQAAENIGADALLTRVGALYHDAGKAIDSIFFIENLVPGNRNPHNDLDPNMSSSIIISHVTRGLDLARKYRLPRRIQDFILEHHGSTITRYQYSKAVDSANGDETKVDMEQFRYPGPRPQSRETALVLLADGCEARVRAEHPQEEEEIRRIIKDTIDNQIALGELDDTDLTLHELDIIVESFTATLRGIYHPRIKYPQIRSTAEIEEEASQPLALPYTELDSPAISESDSTPSAPPSMK